MATSPHPPDRDRRGGRLRAVSAETVASVHAYAAISPDDYPDPPPAALAPRGGDDDHLYEVAVSSSALIRAQLRASVAEHLGPEFDVELDFERGSVELVATILLVGSVVMTYGAVRSGLDYIRNDAAAVLRRVLAPATPPPIEVAPYVTLGPAMSKFALADQASGSSSGTPPISYLVLIVGVVVAVLLTILLVVVFVKVL